jgi:hypothetical protein
MKGERGGKATGKRAQNKKLSPFPQGKGLGMGVFLKHKNFLLDNKRREPSKGSLLKSFLGWVNCNSLFSHIMNIILKCC